jgi:hypothetical protein
MIVRGVPVALLCGAAAVSGLGSARAQSAYEGNGQVQAAHAAAEPNP